MISIDFEFLPDYNPELFSYYDGKDEIVWDFRASQFTVEKFISEFDKLIKKHDKIVIHNAQAELKVLHAIGYDIRKLYSKIEDTMLMAHVLDTEQLKDLDTLGMKILGEGKTMTYKDAKAREIKDQVVLQKIYPTWPICKHPQGIPDLFIEYSRKDPKVTYEIYKNVAPILSSAKYADQSVCYDLEKALLRPIMEMHVNGIFVDVPKLQGLEKDLRAELQETMENMSEYCGYPIFVKVKKSGKQDPGTFNPNSRQQLGTILYQDFKFPVLKETKGGVKGIPKPSTDSDTLELLLDLPDGDSNGKEFVKCLIDYSKKTKLITSFASPTFYDEVESDSRIRCDFDSTKRTGRFSARTPPMQTLPKSGQGKKIRGCFTVQKGNSLLCCDYSQIEYRLLAEIIYITTGDKTLLQFYLDDKDAHQGTADLLTKYSGIQVSRDAGKTFNFAVVYGQGINRIASSLGITLPEAQSLYRAYFQALPGIREAKTKIIESARQAGAVVTLSGRRRGLGRYFYSNDGALDRVAFNTMIQGSAADLIKIAMIKISQYFADKPDYKLTLQVHDELLAECKKANAKKYLKDMVNIMETAHVFNVPIKVDGGIGINWLEAKG